MGITSRLDQRLSAVLLAAMIIFSIILIYFTLKAEKIAASWESINYSVMKNANY